MNVSKTPNINLYHGNGEEAINLARCKNYDLAIVDPPYGMKANELIPGSDVSSTGVKRKQKSQRIKQTIADQVPDDAYYSNLFKKAKNQIIWGWNHLLDSSSGHLIFNSGRGRIIWDKNNPVLSSAEIAYQSFTRGTYSFEYTWSGFCKNGENTIRIHPTQKPVALYKWLLQNYAKPGDKILDTHGGSMSIAIACYDLGFDLDLWEIDEDYYNAGVERVKNHIKQGQLFNPAQVRKDQAQQQTMDF